MAPRILAHGVDIWVPELGGKYNAKNATHNMMMSMLGGLSESERQHVQQRTRASMDAQVLNEGRHQGGRPTGTSWSTDHRIPTRTRQRTV
ncbi:recombinase family protein [Nocardia brasiliensis]|uniref:recombinase family protein n=1 Tax=Nocardia brasiliensis TaxID=37326 RepID=UPI0006885C80|nr:recombinase family protein [Nocardia brasiliensis]OCF85975.1 hypothetical protein AW168_32945 [Nocardia brasiliensis]